MSNVVYAIERLNQWRRDSVHLLKEHAQLSFTPEVPFELDWQCYERLEAIGYLLIYTVRIDGELVGYSIFATRKPHHHYKSLSVAINDLIYLSPDHRGKGIGRGLFDFIEDDLRRRGIDLIQARAKIAHPELGRMLEARGYTSDEVDYTRRL